MGKSILLVFPGEWSEYKAGNQAFLLALHLPWLDFVAWGESSLPQFP